MTWLRDKRRRRRNKHSPEFPKEWEQPPLPSDDVLSRARFIGSDKHGFGDGIAASWLSEATKGTDSPLVHCATDKKAQLLHALGQYVTPESRAGMFSWRPAYGVEISNRISRLDAARQQWGIKESPVRPQPLELPADVEEWAEAQGGDVLICPHTVQGCRKWPNAYWVDMLDELSIQGLRTLVMLGHHDRAFESDDCYIELDWRCSLALMRRMKLVVGNDSGPIHLATVANVPALAVLGPTPPSIFAHADNVSCIAAEDVPCIYCYWEPPYRKACRIGCQALMRLTPDTVVRRALELMSPSLSVSENSA